MNKIKLACAIFSLTLCLAIFGGLTNHQITMAQDDREAPPPEEKIELDTKYPVLSGAADTTFEFEVELNYTGGDKEKVFELRVSGPSGWATVIQQSTYETKQISSIKLDPMGYPETIVVMAMAPFWLYPEPKDYTITFEAAEATTGNPKNSLELTARITARYGFSAETTEGRLNMKAKAGEDGYLPIVITNSGTATLDKITFSSTKPEGWSITFKPEKIEALAPGAEQEIEVAIKPPSNTIAGDYMTTLRFDSEPESSSEPPKLDIRVTVTTPTRWGWIGAGIVVAVIAGLVVTFTRLGRR